MDFLLSNRWIPLLATVGAAALAVFVGISNLEDIRAIHAPVTGGTVATGGAKDAPSPQLNLAEIASWHLFGVEKAPETAAPVKPVIQRTDAPKTRLKLTLQGIFSPLIEGQEGWAIIEAPQEEPRAYRIGDELPGGATLSAVESDQVILTRNGRQESLPLEQEALDVSFDEPEHDLPGDEEMAPKPSPRARARTRAINPNVGMEEPVEAGLPEPYMDPNTEAEPPSYETPIEEPSEPEPPISPAVQSANQDLVDEMKRLRESFEQSQ